MHLNLASEIIFHSLKREFTQESIDPFSAEEKLELNTLAQRLGLDCQILRRYVAKYTAILAATAVGYKMVLEERLCDGSICLKFEKENIIDRPIVVRLNEGGIRFVP